jgi:recombination protein RecA
MTDLKIVDMPKKGKKPPRRVSDPDEKKAAIKQAMATYKKTHNSELSMNQADKDEILIQALPSGILSLDMIIGCGGYPQGRLIELFGKESSGKTTVALQAVASVQKRGGIASYVDVENSVNINYAENLGVVARELLLSQPDTAEDAFDTIETLVETGAIDLIVLDSVAALTPQSQIDGVKIKGDQEAIISERLRHLIGLVNKTKTVVIFINQTRPALDDPFAQRETTPGGPALKSYASVRLEVKEGEKFPETGKKIGNKATI